METNIMKPLTGRIITTNNTNNTNNTSTSNNSGSKNEYRTKEERVSELIPVLIKIRDLGISEEFEGYAKFLSVVRDFINNGTTLSGVIKVPEIGREFAYLFNKKKKFKIDIVLKKS